MELKENKIEFDLEELTSLLIADKTEGFRHISEKILNAVLEREFEAYIGAGKHERSHERKDYRNGHKERLLKTTLGELNLLRPYARSGKFETKLFKNYSRIDKALVSMIVESYLKGVSTRKVEAVISALDIELSHGTVSNLSHELDELVTQFKTSPLHAYYPYLYVDATYLKVFDGSRFVSRAILIAVGVNEEGYREILDMASVESESHATYADFFDGLKARGMERIDLIISDGHKGIKKAASESFIGSSWQLCSVHFKRNLLKVVPGKDSKTILEEINTMLRFNTIQDAIDYANDMAEAYETSHPRLVKYLSDNVMDVLTFLAFPKSHHRKIHSTNVLERFNKEIKRRTRVVGAFPRDNSVLRLLVPLAVDTNAKWLDRKYVSWDNLVQSEEAEEEFTENF